MTESTMQVAAPLRRRGGPTGYEYENGICRPLRAFEQALSVLLVIYVLCCGLLLLATSYWLIDPRIFGTQELVDDGSSDIQRLFLASAVFSLLALAERLLMFICAITVARFTYRAMKNLYTVRSPVPDMSPIGTVLWYFVPFANFVKPSQGVHEIYSGSFEEAGMPVKSGVVSKWWAAWIVSVLASIVSNSSFAASGVVYAGVMISVLSSAIAALLLRGIVQEVAQAQEAMVVGGRVTAFD